MSFQYEHPRAAIAVDIVVFGYDEAETELRILLIQRGTDPFSGRWALPGGFVDIGRDETTDEAAKRELAEETGVDDIFFEQLCTVSTPHRDPRGRVVTVAHFALINLNAHPVKASSDARDARWFPLNDLPPLAFDHQEIVDTATKRLRSKVRYQPLGFELLPELFTLTQLQRLYETVLESTLDKRNFRKKVLRLGLVEDSGEVQKDVPHRAAVLYRFDAENHARLSEYGFELALP